MHNMKGKNQDNDDGKEEGKYQSHAGQFFTPGRSCSHLKFEIDYARQNFLNPLLLFFLPENGKV